MSNSSGSPPSSPGRVLFDTPPSSPSAGRMYGGRKEIIQEGLKAYRSDVVADANNDKSPSSSAFWAGLDDDDY